MHYVLLMNLGDTGHPGRKPALPPSRPKQCCCTPLPHTNMEYRSDSQLIHLTAEAVFPSAYWLDLHTSVFLSYCPKPRCCPPPPRRQAERVVLVPSTVQHRLLSMMGWDYGASILQALGQRYVLSVVRTPCRFLVCYKKIVQIS